MPLFQLVLDQKARKGLVDVTKWFESIIKMPEFMKAAGKIHLCSFALKPMGMSAPKQEKKGGAKKEKK